MTEIDYYIRILFLERNGKLGISQTPQRREEMLPVINHHVAELLSSVGYPTITDIDTLAEELLDQMIEAHVVKVEKIQFAGEYLTFKAASYVEYRNKVLTGDAIYAAAQRIGPRFFKDIFNGYTTQAQDENVFPELGFAPAAGRVVTFSDNQISELDEQTGQIIDAITSQNQIAGIAGLRELVLGQISAGRELIRAGTFRLHLMQLTLFQTLRFLAERYEREVIGGLAAALLTALAKHIGIDA